MFRCGLFTEFFCFVSYFSDGQTMLLKKSDSAVDTMFVPRWPPVADVLRVKDEPKECEVPAELIGKPMVSH